MMVVVGERRMLSITANQEQIPERSVKPPNKWNLLCFSFRYGIC